MGIQSNVNQVIGAVGSALQPEDPEKALKEANLQLKQRKIDLKNQDLDLKTSALKLKQDKLNEKRAAFERSLERRQFAMDRAKKGKELSESQKRDIDSLLAEAQRKREARAKLNG